MDVKQNIDLIIPRWLNKNARVRVLTLLAIAMILTGLYLFIDREGELNFILQLRGLIVITMILVAIATGVSTLLFQTLTHNRILTPAVMGLESLFVFIQSAILFFADVINIVLTGRVEKFIMEILAMMVFSTLLYRWLLNIKRSNINTILLTGIVCGILFSSGTALLQRLLSPGEFAILQSRIFAMFTRSDPLVLLMAGIVIFLTLIPVWCLRHRLDVIALGRDHALALGIDYDKLASCIMLFISLLVAMSTALVGPLTFLGLLVANLTYAFVKSWRHSFLLPGVILNGVIILLAGQLILSHVFNMSGALSVVIEFCGGILFITLLLRRQKID